MNALKCIPSSILQPLSHWQTHRLSWKLEIGFLFFLGRKLFSEVYLESVSTYSLEFPVCFRQFNWTLFRIQVLHRRFRKWTSTIISLRTSIIRCTNSTPWYIRISVQVCSETWPESVFIEAFMASDTKGV